MQISKNYIMVTSEESYVITYCLLSLRNITMTQNVTFSPNHKQFVSCGKAEVILRSQNRNILEGLDNNSIVMVNLTMIMLKLLQSRS